jgi:PAS domain S-box-containing protein
LRDRGQIDSERALVLAPQGRDAAIALTLLREIAVTAEVCPDLPALVREIARGGGLAVVTEEALQTADLSALASWIDAQPSWSDFPFLLLTHRGGGTQRNPTAFRLSGILGNVTFLERPFRPSTFSSVVRTALRGRRRQYDAKHAEKTLQTLNESLETQVQERTRERDRTWALSQDLLAVGTIRGQIVSANPAWQSVLGRPFQSVRDHGFFELVHPEDHAEAVEAVRDLRRIQEVRRFTSRLRHADGSYRWISWTAVPEGEFFYATGRDVTNEREAHAALALAQEQLHQSQKLEMIGQLTGGIAHDFNNLLTAVLSNLDLLHKRLAGNPEAERLIAGAVQGAERGATLTQRLLAFARRQDLEIKAVDVAALVGDMTDLMTRSVGPRVEVRIEAPRHLPTARADPSQLELALLNLAVNAGDAMPDGGTLTVALDSAPAPNVAGLASGDLLRIRVSDTGVGMDPETLQRAIEPFFSTKEVGKGTGLGLSMVHGFAAQLGGTLRLLSAPGRGTTAELWLPVGSPVAAGVEPPPTTASRPVQPVAAAAPVTVLVVDDDVLIAMSTVDLLEDIGYQVIEANSGTGALEILRSGAPVDLILTDYAMPGMTGVELAGAARAIRPDLPVLLATGYAELPAGATTDLPRMAKPFRQDQLAREVAKVLGASKPARGRQAGRVDVEWR